MLEVTANPFGLFLHAPQVSGSGLDQLQLGARWRLFGHRQLANRGRPVPRNHQHVWIAAILYLGEVAGEKLLLSPLHLGHGASPAGSSLFQSAQRGRDEPKISFDIKI